MLSRSVPPFVAQMREIAELFYAEQPELDRMCETLAGILQQFYIKTATYSLETWEKDFGLPIDPELTLQERRGRLLAKLNSTPVATVKALENLVQQTMGANRVIIKEHPERYCFDVYVNTDQLVESFKLADAAVHAARPAHLSYKFINLLIRRAESCLYYGVVGGNIYKTKGVAK